MIKKGGLLMSSGVVLLNKTGIAVATDSAVTIGRRSAIFNSAQKIFEVGTAPVLIANYGHGDFFNVPIDVIFKQFSLYVKQHSIRKDYIIDYAKEFWRFLEEKQQFFMFEKNEFHFYTTYVRKIIKELLNSIEFPNKTDDLIIQIQNQALYLQKESVELPYEKNENNFSFSYAIKKYPNILSTAYEKYFENRFDRDFEKEPLNDSDKKIIAILQPLAEDFTQYRYFFEDMSVGVCFTGYGEKELYPSSFHYVLLGVVQGRSIICRKSENIINDDYTRALVKLAQTDVITTIVDGIHPDIRRTIFDSVTSYANTFFQRTLPSLTKKEFNLDKFKDSFAQEVINKIDEDFNDLTHDIWYKFYSSISVLPIQDLAALAESFISLQSMKRKYEMDSSLNSTVGGPIDVAIITKTEGVKWIKNSK
jgi:hypothetical protein